RSWAATPRVSRPSTTTMRPSRPTWIVSSNTGHCGRRAGSGGSSRGMWQARGFAAMYRRMLAGEDVIARMLARDDGERRMTNLLHLGEALQDAAAAGVGPDRALAGVGG